MKYVELTLLNFKELEGLYYVALAIVTTSIAFACFLFDNYRAKILLIGVAAAVFSIGIANRSLGSDSVFYASFYESLPSQIVGDLRLSFWQQVTGAPEARIADSGFIYLSSVLKTLGADVSIYFAVIAALIFGILIFQLRTMKVSLNYIAAALGIFICTPIALSVSANVLRQGLAAPLLMLALLYLYTNRTKEFCIAAFASISFHWSAVAFVLAAALWEIVKPVGNKIKFIMLLFCCFVLIASLGSESIYSATSIAGDRVSIVGRFFIFMFFVAACYRFGKSKSGIFQPLLSFRLPLLVVQLALIAKPEMFIRLSVYMFVYDLTLLTLLLDSKLSRMQVAALYFVCVLSAVVTYHIPMAATILGY